MKRTTLLLLITYVSCFSLVAQPAKSRRPGLPPNITALAREDSYQLLKNPLIKARIQKLLGTQYDSFMESFETLNPIKKEEKVLFSSGCLIHACTHLESAISVDLVRRTIHVAIFRQNEKTRVFNEGDGPTPKIIRDWAQNLGKANNEENSSQTKRLIATSDVAEATVEISTPRQLRNLVPVHAFIGGESHAGYVVRARKGSVVTVRLSSRSEGANYASFVVSESPDYNSGEPAKFGVESNKGKRWAGTIPRTGEYYVYVVAHPSAHYTIMVRVSRPEGPKVRSAKT